jgi:hypothetical protein
MRDRGDILRFGSVIAPRQRHNVGRSGTKSTQHHQQLVRGWYVGNIPFRRIQRPHRCYFQQRTVNSRNDCHRHRNRMGLEHGILRFSGSLLRGECQQSDVGIDRNSRPIRRRSAGHLEDLHPSNRRPPGCTSKLPLPGKRVLVQHRSVRRSRRPGVCGELGTQIKT